MFVYLQGTEDIFRRALENSGVRALLLSCIVSKRFASFCFGRRMVAHVCRKPEGTLAEFSREVNSLPASDLGILAPEQFGKAGRRQYIIELYDLLRPSLHAYLRYQGINRDQAEDVIQDTFVRLVSCRFDRGGEDNLRAWIFRVAHNLSMDVHRAQRRWSRGKDNEPRPAIRERIDPAPSPEQQVLLGERMRRFEHTFAQLTPKQRQCVLLRAEGFRYREIATTLGVSVQRVGELMQRSIALLEADT
jgi:RNA polymerase sigma-70 factor (ECF subfamily)